MAASKDDLLQEVGLPGAATTLSSPGYTIGDTSITVESTANHPTTTGYTFAIDRVEVVNGVQTRIEGSYCEFVGVRTDATTISSVEKTYGDPQDYPAGTTTRVYIPVSSTRENRLVEWGTAHANQDGTLKTDSVSATQISAAAVTADKIQSQAVTTAKVADDAVTAAKLEFGLIRQRQGGTTGDDSWATSGTTNTDTSAKSVFIQAGVIDVNANPKTVTFPVAFGQAPTVQLTSQAVSVKCFPVLSSTPTTTTFAVQMVADDGTVKTTEKVHWLAIGQ